MADLFDAAAAAVSSLSRPPAPGADARGADAGRGGDAGRGAAPPGGAGPAPRRTTARTMDPVPTARFTISLDKDGGQIGSFTEISGLGVTVQVEELVAGGENGFVHRLPSGMKWQNIVLKRGVTDSNALLGWLAECSGPGLESQQEGQYRVPLRTATITVHDPAGKPVRRWRVERALPVRWTGPRFSASARELAVEELEVSHGGLYPDPPR
jgi:phage tail-like protein